MADRYICATCGHARFVHRHEEGFYDVPARDADCTVVGCSCDRFRATQTGGYAPIEGLCDDPMGGEWSPHNGPHRKLSNCSHWEPLGGVMVNPVSLAQEAERFAESFDEFRDRLLELPDNVIAAFHEAAIYVWDAVNLLTETGGRQ